MGYTHYWRLAKISQHSTRFEACAKDMRKIIEAAPQLGITLCGPSGDASMPVEFETDDEGRPFIAINGKGADSHESFHWPPTEDFDFCKTAEKPYDVIVVACLAVAAEIFGTEIDVTSDGDRKDWADGVRFAEHVLGRDIPNPIED